MFKITDHSAGALERLATEFRDRPKLAALFVAMIDGLQDVEDLLWQLFDETVDTATTAQLDVFGDLIGQARGSSTFGFGAGSDDVQYRKYIKARARVHRATGVADDIFAVLKIVLGDAVQLEFKQSYPAQFSIRIIGAMDPYHVGPVQGFVRDAAAAGVYVVFEFQLQADAETFMTESLIAFTSQAHIATETTLNVVSTAGFPSSGVLDIGLGTIAYEQKNYSAKTATTFTLTAGLTESHEINESVITPTVASLGLGFDDEADPGEGGKFANAMVAFRI